MGIARKLCHAAMAAAILLTSSSCAPEPRPEPTPEQAVRVLSYAILQPDTTCAQLREDFELDNLPLVDDPDDIDLAYEEHWLASHDDEVLRVWYMPVADERGLVIVSAGAVGPLKCYLYSALLLTEAGWSVVMYEYEGFGASSGEPQIETLQPGLNAVLDWTLTRTGYEQVTLMGMSLGTIPSVAVAVERPDAVNGVILDSPLALGAEIERFKALIGGQSEELIALLEPRLLPEAIIDQMTQPLLVFLHEEDIVTPPDSVELLYELAGGPKELVRFPGLDHAHAQFLETASYTAHLVTFLDDIWLR